MNQRFLNLQERFASAIGSMQDFRACEALLQKYPREALIH